MDGLFSHAAAEDEPSLAHYGMIAGVTVPVPPADAFEAFTDLIHLWWPLQEYSEFGIQSHLSFEGQALVEESIEGQEVLWATVREWQPPSFFALDLFFGASPNNPTQLRVDFHPNAGETSVALSGNGQTSAAGLDWPMILARFARFMGVG